MSSTHPSCLDGQPETCARCELNPCSCSYMQDLRPGHRLGYLRDVALEQFTKPLPHREPCPCPICYSVRLATWTRNT